MASFSIVQNPLQNDIKTRATGTRLFRRDVGPIYLSIGNYSENLKINRIEGFWFLQLELKIRVMEYETGHLAALPGRLYRFA
jgi:hypothetical protein